MSQNVMTQPAIARPDCDPATRVTKSLLGYGVLAGPCYVLVVLGQALARPGFSLVHDDASLLSNGSFGWVQILNFALTGSPWGWREPSDRAGEPPGGRACSASSAWASSRPDSSSPTRWTASPPARRKVTPPWRACTGCCTSLRPASPFWG